MSSSAVLSDKSGVGNAIPSTKKSNSNLRSLLKRWCFALKGRGTCLDIEEE
jgi:hypothetical protein